MTEVLAPNTLEHWRLYPIEFIRMLVNPQTNKRFDLFPAQIQWFDHCFQRRADGQLKYPEQGIGWIKGTGKTVTAAMQFLTMLLVYGGRYAQGYCCASDLQQAQGRVYAACKRIIESTPLLRPEAEITRTRITFPQIDSFIEATGADSSGAAGVRPTMISFDEIHGITTERARRLWDEMIPISLGENQKISCRLTTTHAGYSGESTLLEEFCSKGLALPLIGKDLHAGNGMLFTWSHLPEAPWQTEQWLAEQRERTRPIQYLRQFENRFVTSEAEFITGAMWDDITTLSAADV